MPELSESEKIDVRSVMDRIDERTLGNLRMIAQGARAITNPESNPFSPKAFEQSDADVARAALAVRNAEKAAGMDGVLTSAQLPEHLAKQVVRQIKLEQQPAIAAGRAA